MLKNTCGCNILGNCCYVNIINRYVQYLELEAPIVTLLKLLVCLILAVRYYPIMTGQCLEYSTSYVFMLTCLRFGVKFLLYCSYIDNATMQWLPILLLLVAMLEWVICVQCFEVKWLLMCECWYVQCLNGNH